jgi:hypothetical protein
MRTLPSKTAFLGSSAVTHAGRHSRELRRSIGADAYPREVRSEDTDCDAPNCRLRSWQQHRMSRPNDVGTTADGAHIGRSGASHRSVIRPILGVTRDR